jgi:hypothetical protein
VCLLAFFVCLLFVGVFGAFGSGPQCPIVVPLLIKLLSVLAHVYVRLDHEYFSHGRARTRTRLPLSPSPGATPAAIPE